MTTKTCRLVAHTESGWDVSEYPIERFAEAMAEKGYSFTGLNRNASQRAELQGAPRFSDLCGPMWDGDAICYETREAYAKLSM